MILPMTQRFVYDLPVIAVSGWALGVGLARTDLTLAGLSIALLSIGVVGSEEASG